MIYFIQSGENGPIKIGYTDGAASLPSRLLSLQIGNPEPLSVIYTMEGNMRTEQMLHWAFDEHHIRGEWFERHGALEAIEKCKADPSFPMAHFLSIAAAKAPAQHPPKRIKRPPSKALAMMRMRAEADAEYLKHKSAYSG